MHDIQRRADRYLLNPDGTVNEKQTEILMNIYNGFDIEKKINEIYKQDIYSIAFNTTSIQKDKINLDIIT